MDTPGVQYLVEIYDGSRFNVSINAFRDELKFHKAELKYWFGFEDETPGLKYSINCSMLGNHK